MLAQLSHKRIQAFLSSVCAQSCQTPCNPIDHSLSGSSVPGILQARLERAPISSSRLFPQPREGTCTSCIGRHFTTLLKALYHCATKSVIIKAVHSITMVEFPNSICLVKTKISFTPIYLELRNSKNIFFPCSQLISQ